MDRKLNLLSDRESFRAVLRQQVVEQNYLCGYRPNLPTLCIVRTLCRGYKQAKHEPGYRRDERRTKSHNVLRIFAQVCSVNSLRNNAPHSGNMFFRSSVARKSANTRIRALSRLWAWRRTQSSAQCSAGTSNVRTSVMSRSHK
jgi:hypothetical protein